MLSSELALMALYSHTTQWSKSPGLISKESEVHSIKNNVHPLLHVTIHPIICPQELTYNVLIQPNTSTSKLKPDTESKNSPHFCSSHRQKMFYSKPSISRDMHIIFNEKFAHKTLFHYILDQLELSTLLMSRGHLQKQMAFWLYHIA